jgi:ribonuclease R
MSLREQILALVRSSSYKPTDEAGLLKQLGLEKKRKASLSHEVRLLLSSGELNRFQGDRLRWAGSEGEIIGKLMVRGSGMAFVRPEASSPEADKGDIRVDDDFTGTALSGDTVAVRVLAARHGRERREGAQRFGRLLRVVERAHETIVGTLVKDGKHPAVRPDDPRLPLIRLNAKDPGEMEKQPNFGDKVVLQPDPWTDPHSAPTGILTRRLGRQFEPRAEMLGVFEKFSLETHFPEAVEREAASMPSKVRPADLVGREDFREIPTLTIDPDDAKDFDDALSLEPMPNGDLRVGIHIADVSHYVKSGSALDREAQKRGNSTYLVGTVIPMLPVKLSNGLCSLVEAEDRLTIAAILTFDKTAKIKRTEFARCVIRSRKRLSYRQAYALLFKTDFDEIRGMPALPSHQTGATGRPLSSLTDIELVDLQSWLRKLWAIAKRLRADRMAHGSLDLDMPETKIFVDKEGYAERLERMTHDESHQLIEEFMLAANDAVARLTRTQKLHSLYRVHDEPDFRKLAEFREFAATMGVRCGELTRREEIIRLLAATDHHPQGYLLKTNLLRSLRKACYRASPDGHYGLFKQDYTHFTSPIRRYSDLVVHRVLARYLERQAGGQPEQDSSLVRGPLDSLAEHLSETETNSQEAERESFKIKQLEFFERESKRSPKTRFKAVITELRMGGMFIELEESMTFGYIKEEGLPSDRYERSQDGKALVGRRARRRFTLGSTIDVVVSNVDRQRRLIDFEYVD